MGLLNIKTSFKTLKGYGSFIKAGKWLLIIEKQSFMFKLPFVCFDHWVLPKENILLFYYSIKLIFFSVGTLYDYSYNSATRIFLR